MAVQNSLSPTVDILNQDTGKVITHYSENADRVVNLSQTSIVRINASPETVNFYERQGNDLIVHMKDGTTVRYQNFFHLDAEGQHSELIFEDDKAYTTRCSRSPLKRVRRLQKRLHPQWLIPRLARSPALRG
ncbi:hypothetical protein DOX58_05065 [Cronobacter sakazakii]|nr:hypothetical protein [Cronobacter sakazakii]